MTDITNATEVEAKPLCYPFSTETCNNADCPCRDEKRAALAAFDAANAKEQSK